jgi:hypothetical protein
MTVGDGLPVHRHMVDKTVASRQVTRHVSQRDRLVRNAAHFQWCGARLQTGLVSENESPAICSAKACRAFATWAVVWNNPRLHTPDREKVWVACGEHKQPLADYLAVRSFLKRVEPLGPV